MRGGRARNASDGQDAHGNLRGWRTIRTINDGRAADEMGLMF